MNEKNPGIVKYISVIVLAALTSLLIGMGGFGKEYSLISDEGALDLKNTAFELNDSSFDPSTGEYTAVPEGDPYILYNGIGGGYKGVYLNLASPADRDITFKVYWTAAGDENLSEKLSESRIIKKGYDSSFIKLSSYDLGIVRVNISDNCVINSLMLTSKNVRVRYLLSPDNIKALIIRFILIAAVLLTAAFAFEEEKRAGKFSVRNIFTIDDKNGNRRYELDYVRTVAAIMVIMMHSICDIFIPYVEKGQPGYGTFRFVLALSLGCNALYVMLSGCLILRPSEESIKDFYIKRAGRVVIPTLCYYFLYMFLGYPREMFGNGILEGLKNCGKELLSGRSAYMPHMWLVYTIMGLYILAPFLRIMLRHITEGQLFGLLICGFVINVLVMYLPLAGMTFGIETPIASWIGLFLLGYYMNTDHAKKYYTLFMILGLVGFIASFVMIYHDPDILYYTCNQAPNMWLVGCGVFAFFNRFKNIFGKKNIIIGAFSKYNFSIMLVHILLLMKLVLPIGWRLEYEHGHLSLFIVLIIVVCLILSYICALIYDNTAVKAAMFIYNRITERFLKKRD
ncbi:MAG: acyltransferase [Lachnospiraceae bacterium]|nr:acyltransferase [Lachnospiraceae bacterium]